MDLELVVSTYVRILPVAACRLCVDNMDENQLNQYCLLHTFGCDFQSTIKT